MAREGVAPPRESNMANTVAAVVKETTTVVAESSGLSMERFYQNYFSIDRIISGTVTIQYTHILFALAAFVILSVAVVTVIKRRARQKTGFRNRRGGHSILQQDSDEDDILISSMYS